MHELSVAAEVLRIVECAAEREQFARVATLELEVGALACVDIDALRFAIEVIAKGTVLEGVALQIAQPSGAELRVHRLTVHDL